MTYLHLRQNLISGFLITLIGSSISSIAQPILTDRQKDFGKSLKKYESKNTAPQSPTENQTDEDVIRVNTDFIVTDALVVNDKGNVVLGLKKEDFIITEDGVEQEIAQFTLGEKADVPRSVVLIFDYSTSLLPYIKTSVESAKLFVDKLGPQDRIALVTDDVELLVDFTSDKTSIKNALDRLQRNTLAKTDGGKSKQYSALLSVVNELFRDEDLQPIIIFQTDGDELMFLDPRWKEWDEFEKKVKALRLKPKYDYSERPFSLLNVGEAVERSRATIYTVIPGLRFTGLSADQQIEQAKKSLWASGVKDLQIPEKLIAVELRARLSAQSALANISRVSGGYADFLEKPEDAEMIYSTILQTMNNRYIIGYYPNNDERNGRRRIVNISVKGHPEYTIVGRKAYIAAVSK